MLSLRYAEEIEIVNKEMVNFLEFTRDKIKKLERELGRKIDLKNTIESQSSSRSQVLKLCIQLVLTIYSFNVHKCVLFLTISRALDVAPVNVLS